jgi:hypothetical protein
MAGGIFPVKMRAEHVFRPIPLLTVRSEATEYVTRFEATRGGRLHPSISVPFAQQPGTPEPPGTPPQPPPDPTAPPPYEDPPRPIPIPRPDEPPVIDDPPSTPRT